MESENNCFNLDYEFCKIDYILLVYHKLKEPQILYTIPINDTNSIIENIDEDYFLSIRDRVKEFIIYINNKYELDNKEDLDDDKILEIVKSIYNIMKNEKENN